MTTSNTPIYASQARPWLKFYDQKYIRPDHARLHGV